jgi:SAM-dependent methyltransferase
MEDQCMEMSDSEKAIYNEGERLIPGVTHGINEIIRHKSSYNFFRTIIENDILMKSVSGPITILDLGCGVGHGCAMLAEIPGVRVIGVDISPECITYAREHYGRPNIDYRLEELDFISSMPEYDYIVSRGVIEHIPNGLEVTVKTRWKNRLLFNVPYNEAPGNPHHILLGITEKNFEQFTRSELFYEDLGGITYDIDTKPPAPNMITCICSSSNLLKIKKTNIAFPLPAWEEELS